MNLEEAILLAYGRHLSNEELSHINQEELEAKLLEYVWYTKN